MKKLTMMFLMAMVSMVFGASSVLADDFRCVGKVGARTVENLYVPTGSSCQLVGTRVQGNILVERSASLNARNTRVNGSIHSEGYNEIIIQGGTRVTGSIQLKQGNTATITSSTINGDVQFEENFGTSKASFNSIGGSLQGYKNRGFVHFFSNSFVAGNIQTYENIAGVSINGNTTDANLQVYDNRGGILVTDNRVAENFQCYDNQPPFTQNGNQVGGEFECKSF